MKVRRLQTALALLLSVALCACARSAPNPASTAQSAATTAPDVTDPTGSGETDAYKIGVFYYDFSDAYISAVRDTLDQELEKRGAPFQVFDAGNNQTTQNEQLQTAIADGCNLLLINIVSSGSLDATNEVLNITGDLPVVFFNRAIEPDGEEGAVLNDADQICFIGTDAPQAGHLQGQMIGEYLLAHYNEADLNGDGVISYAMFKGEENNVEAIYRTRYAQEDADAILKANGLPALQYFDESNEMKYQVDLTGSWSARAAQSYMTANLTTYNLENDNMIELIICNNDNMADGCIWALERVGMNTGERGATTIPVFGVDATATAQSLIRAGKMTGTVEQDAAAMAIAIVDVAEEIGNQTATKDAVSKVAAKSALLSIAQNMPNKLYMAYSPYTGQ